MRLLGFALLALLLVFVLPAGAALLAWQLGEHPASWRAADWSSARILPEAGADRRAAVYVLSARTGGLKGALSEHSWIVLKEEGSARFERYDKVGWGAPVRRDMRPADGRWYSNVPRIIASLEGEAATRAIPRIRAAIAAYPFQAVGGYRIFPGPNSNSFVAHVLRAVPEIGAVLPPAAVGRDFPTDGRLLRVDRAGGEVALSLFGYAGITVGLRSGLEVNVLGLVAGLDPFRLVVKVPGFGSVSPLR